MALENEFRYWQSYQSARMAVRISSLLRGSAILVLALICLLGLMAGAANSGELARWFMVAVCVPVPLYLVAVIFDILGRILVMETDTAVNSSPQLTDDEKVTIVARNWKD